MTTDDNSAGQDKQTTVEEGTEFKGTLSSSCPVVVRGAVDGEIDAPSVTVTSSGTLVGHARAKQISSDGVIAGEVDADEVSLSGSVRSDTIIRAKTLEVKLRHERGKLEVAFGECVLDVGDDPAIEASDETAKRKDAESAKSMEATEANGGDKAKVDENSEDDEGQGNGKSKSLSVPPVA